MSNLRIEAFIPPKISTADRSRRERAIETKKPRQRLGFFRCISFLYTIMVPVVGLPAALGQCRRQPGELGNDTLYRFRPSWGRSLRVPFPDHHFNKNIPPFGRIFLLERVMGLEPTISAWKANVLPLHYTRVLSCKWCGRRDLNSYALRHWNLNPARLPIPPRPQAYYSNLVTRRRFELRTP